MTTSLAALLDRVIAGETLDGPAMTGAIEAIMGGDAEPLQVAGLLAALRTRGESVTELAAATAVMRRLATRVDVDVPHLVDTCGTGGSRAKLFNISTAAAFVAAAGGAHVAKHGNRAMSSRTGSADVLEAAGVNLALAPEQVARCIREVGIGFLFAQAHHSAMRHVAPIRRALGVRTLFNLLGPMSNPAAAPNQLIGVFAPQWTRPVAEALAQLGSRHVWVVHSAEGLDELSLAGPSTVCECRDGRVREFTVTPAEAGLDAGSLDGLVADDAAHSLRLVEASLAGVDSPAARIVALNAGAALHVSGIARSLRAGVAMAQDVQASGLATERLDDLVRTTRLMAGT